MCESVLDSTLLPVLVKASFLVFCTLQVIFYIDSDHVNVFTLSAGKSSQK